MAAIGRLKRYASSCGRRQAVFRFINFSVHYVLIHMDVPLSLRADLIREPYGLSRCSVYEVGKVAPVCIIYLSPLQSRDEETVALRANQELARLGYRGRLSAAGVTYLGVVGRNQ
jgi:hypothetical protein